MPKPLDSLLSLIAPPDTPTADNSRLLAFGTPNELTLTLPDDFLELCEIYGSGDFGTTCYPGFLKLYSPFDIRFYRRYEGNHFNLRMREDLNYSIYPTIPGVFCWATGENGREYLWNVTDTGDVESVIYSDPSQQIRRYAFSTTDFILKLVRNELDSFFDDMPPNWHAENKDSWNFTPVTPIDPSRNPPPHLAVKFGTVSQVRQEIREGADVNCRDYHGYTPLFHAINRDVGILKALLDAGADPNMTDGEFTVLQRLVTGGSVDSEMIRLLAEAGADVNVVEEEGWTPLLRACQSRNVDDMRILLEYGADVSARMPNGAGAMELVRDDAMVRLLKRFGAS